MSSREQQKHKDVYNISKISWDSSSFLVDSINFFYLSCLSFLLIVSMKSFLPKIGNSNQNLHKKHVFPFTPRDKLLMLILSLQNFFLVLIFSFYLHLNICKATISNLCSSIVSQRLRNVFVFLLSISW